MVKFKIILMSAIFFIIIPIKGLTTDKHWIIIAQDNHYEKYENKIVYDKETNLEWIAGPDKDVHWSEAKSWAEGLSLDGWGWRMPTKTEVKKLYKKGSGSRNMTFLLNNSGWWIWSEEKNGSKGFRFFGHSTSYSSWYHLGFSDDRRVFAVRSRK